MVSVGGQMREVGCCGLCERPNKGRWDVVVSVGDEIRRGGMCLFFIFGSS